MYKRVARFLRRHPDLVRTTRRTVNVVGLAMDFPRMATGCSGRIGTRNQLAPHWRRCGSRHAIVDGRRVPIEDLSMDARRERREQPGLASAPAGPGGPPFNPPRLIGVRRPIQR